MAIQAQSVEVNGLRRDTKLRARVEAQIGDALARIGLTPVSGHVAFVGARAKSVSAAQGLANLDFAGARGVSGKPPRGPRWMTPDRGKS